MKFYIYLIYNIIDNSVYIGHTNNIKRRCSEHNSPNYRKHVSCSRLYRSIEKYGIENFIFDIWEEFDNDTDVESLQKEDFWINYFKSLEIKVMNIARGGRKSRLGIPHTAETRMKMSKSQAGRKFSDEHRQKISEIQTGRKLSEETKLKIGIGNIGKKLTEETKLKIKIGNKNTNVGRKMSEEAKINMSKSQLAKVENGRDPTAKIIICMNKLTKETIEFKSIGDVKRRINIPPTSLKRYLKGLREHELYTFYRK